VLKVHKSAMLNTLFLAECFVNFGCVKLLFNGVGIGSFLGSTMPMPFATTTPVTTLLVTKVYAKPWRYQSYSELPPGLYNKPRTLTKIYTVPLQSLSVTWANSGSRKTYNREV